MRTGTSRNTKMAFRNKSSFEARSGSRTRKVPGSTARIPEKGKWAPEREHPKDRQSGSGRGNCGDSGFLRKEPDAAECMKALKMAAKYICNLRDGLCPMVVEHYPCPVTCTLETLPWHCWIDYFLTGGKGTQPASAESAGADSKESSNRASGPE